MTAAPRRGARGDHVQDQAADALEQIRWACEVGLPGSMALLDAGYGHDSKLPRVSLTLKALCGRLQPQMLVGSRAPPGPGTERGT